MIRSILLVFLFLTLAKIAISQSSPTEIIEKSIAYHDPDGLMTEGTITFMFLETRPGRSNRNTKVRLNESKEQFNLDRTVDDVRIEMQSRKKKNKFKLNGSRKISPGDAEKHGLNEERLLAMRNYYRYLWLLPRTLNDPGTRLDDSYQVVDFFGKTCMEIKVTYDPEVGGDTWYFYFNPQTFALEGYRFYHDESANDGEYILLSEEVSFETVRIPKKREWYTHKEGKFLGTDILVETYIR